MLLKDGAKRMKIQDALCNRHSSPTNRNLSLTSRVYYCYIIYFWIITFSSAKLSNYSNDALVPSNNYYLFINLLTIYSLVLIIYLVINNINYLFINYLFINISK